MSTPLVVLDWIIVADNGNFIKEGKSSVLRMSSILAPREEFHNTKLDRKLWPSFVGKNTGLK